MKTLVRGFHTTSAVCTKTGGVGGHAARREVHHDPPQIVQDAAGVDRHVPHRKAGGPRRKGGVLAGDDRRLPAAGTRVEYHWGRRQWAVWRGEGGGWGSFITGGIDHGQCGEGEGGGVRLSPGASTMGSVERRV